MLDVLVIVLVVAFFAAALLYVRGCARVAESRERDTIVQPPTEAANGAADAVSRPDRGPSEDVAVCVPGARSKP
jgi:hypothetical protein